MQTFIKRPPRLTYFQVGRCRDHSIDWFVELYGSEWETWRSLAVRYIDTRHSGAVGRVLEGVRTSIAWFLEHYLWAEGMPSAPGEFLLLGRSIPNLRRVISRTTTLNTDTTLKTRYKDIQKFMDFVADEGPPEERPALNPFPNINRNDGRSSDVQLSWLTQKHGVEWEQWREYGAKWIDQRSGSVTPYLLTLSWFLEKYLIRHDVGPDPLSLFEPKRTIPDLAYCVLTSRLCQTEADRRIATCRYFLDWVINTDYLVVDQKGKAHARFQNPVKKAEKRRSHTRTETVHNTLPYGYIKELRAQLCPDPGGHFNQWEWARSAIGLSDWFQVAPDLIDPSDPDCVYRVIGEGSSTKVVVMWNPVPAVALFLKLHLPLRSYQVRMLDSGEADWWRYEHGQWEENTRHQFEIRNTGVRRQQGVFRRMPVPGVGTVMTGLYINTNKSADQNKNEVERGYAIPWENEVVLYWLEKLRNWQERYNPIEAPTPWSELDSYHLGHTKAMKTLKAMGSTTFLFRDPSARKGDDKRKPIAQRKLNNIWYQLLKEFQRRLHLRGVTLKNGSPISLVKEDTSCSGTYFPLHCLRVSLITSYAMDGHTPLPVISKLLAGHSRILMTVYYNKITPAVMKRKMADAETVMEGKQQEGIESFLEDAEMEQVKLRSAYLDEGSVVSALANRNPLGWERRHIGLCLAGGNTAELGEDRKAAGCWNGGEACRNKKDQKILNYGPVPHGPENCVRCRWFITDASYLDALRAHFNSLSYRASQAARLSAELEYQKEQLEDERFRTERLGDPFRDFTALKELEKRHESQVLEADEYIKDLRSCFTLIHRIVEAESSRPADDDSTKLIAIGSSEDIHQPLSLVETDSELWQLSEVCRNAEVYPAIADDLRKTPAIEKRSRALNNALIRDGYAPVFMQMDDKMQLILGNAFMRAMAEKACPDDWVIRGIKVVSGVMEAQHSLQAVGILSEGIHALEAASGQQVLKLGSFVTDSISCAVQPLGSF